MSKFVSVIFNQLPNKFICTIFGHNGSKPSIIITLNTYSSIYFLSAQYNVKMLWYSFKFRKLRYSLRFLFIRDICVAEPLSSGALIGADGHISPLRPLRLGLIILVEGTR